MLEAADALGGQIDQVAPDAYRALGKKWQFMREVEEYSDVALGKLAKVGEENFRKGLNARNFTDPSGKFNAEAAQKYFSTKGNQVFALRQQAKLLRQNGAEGLADQIDTSLGELIDGAVRRKEIIQGIEDTVKMMKADPESVAFLKTQGEDQIRAVKATAERFLAKREKEVATRVTQQRQKAVGIEKRIKGLRQGESWPDLRRQKLSKGFKSKYPKSQ